jgi:trk system potassium uptake protein
MDKFIIIGLGTFGKTLALNLMKNNVEVIAVDSNMEIIEEIKNDVTYSVCLDSTDEKALNSLDVKSFNAAIVCIGDDFEANLLTSVLLKNLGLKRIITRAFNPTHIKILKSLGINEVITPEIEIAEKLAFTLANKNLHDIFNFNKDTMLIKIDPPSSFDGKTIGQLNLRNKFGINVIAIEKFTKKDENKNNKNEILETINNPSADTIITKNDLLIVIGNKKDLQKFSKPL